ncbi:MAG: bifunctional diguanylate cyclase/phosphodiesterase, partial [Magnetococcales bacterium]|nr:bifunctional diguanylate cyclase/phosphodiesterase [Magnetococcales bacterium]
RANRQQTLLGLFFLSIDNIKNFNDTFGHGVGDWVLQRVAQVCQNTLRHSDTVARFGGNEFILLVEDAHTVRSLEELMLKLVQRLCDQPAEVEGRLLTISVRMGGVIYPFLEEDALLLQTADIAMHHATREGGNRFAFYDHAMGQAFSRRTLVEHALDTALRLGEFQLLVQPKLWLANGQVLEVEALLRMHSSELGPVSPGEFIPLAEASGQILAIGEWVLREACAMASRWQKQASPMPAIAVNVSAKQIQQQGFVELVSHILQEYGIGKHQLAIEVTESAVMGAISQSAPVLYHLKRLGMSIAVDDFGTGHSSLAYLKQLPIDTLKIDRSFIKDLPGNRHDVAIVEAILAMAGHLELKTVAEGVETLEQQEFLHSCGCQEIQGFYFARPMTEESFLQFLADHDCAVKK